MGEPDRVPSDLGGNQTGIYEFAYEELLNYLGLDEQIASRAWATGLRH